MAMRRNTWIIAAATLASVSLLGACGGDDGSSTPTPTTVSLLQGLFGPGNQEEAAAQQVKAEELTAACMRELGWEYTPVDYSQFNGSDEDQELFNTMYGYQEKYGYGISTFVGVPPEEMPFGGGQEFVDPNQEYVNSLTPDEQSQYYEDLYGMGPEIGEDGEIAGDEIPEPSGCSAEAWAEVSEGQPVFDEDMSEKLNDLYDGFEDDSRVVAAWENWSECMKDKGFEFAKVDEIYTYLQEKTNELTGQEDGGFVPEDSGFTEETTAEGEAAEGDATAATISVDPGIGMPTTTIKDPEALERLKQEEMDIAKADIACQKKHVEKQLGEVIREREQRFLDENPDIAAQLDSKQSGS